MTLGQLFKFLESIDVQMDEIRFKSPNMTAWHRPKRLITSNFTNDATLITENSRGGESHCRWGKRNHISHECNVLNIVVNKVPSHERIGRASRLVHGANIVSVHLSNRTRRG